MEFIMKKAQENLPAVVVLTAIVVTIICTIAFGYGGTGNFSFLK